MTFGGTFSEINLDSPIIDVILLTNIIFLGSNLEISTLNTKWPFFHERVFKEMTKTVIKQQHDLNFGRRNTLRNSTIACNGRIFDGHIEFPYCILLFDISNEQSTHCETVVMWSKFNFNMINIHEEKYHQYLDMYWKERNALI